MSLSFFPDGTGLAVKLLIGKLLFSFYFSEIMLPCNARRKTVISLFISLIYGHRCMMYDDAENAFWWVYLGNFSKLKKFPETLPLESLYQNPLLMMIWKLMFRKFFKCWKIPIVSLSKTIWPNKLFWNSYVEPYCNHKAQNIWTPNYQDCIYTLPWANR